MNGDGSSRGLRNPCGRCKEIPPLYVYLRQCRYVICIGLIEVYHCLGVQIREQDILCFWGLEMRSIGSKLMCKTLLVGQVISQRNVRSTSLDLFRDGRNTGVAQRHRRSIIAVDLQIVQFRHLGSDSVEGQSHDVSKPGEIYFAIGWGKFVDA